MSTTKKTTPPTVPGMPNPGVGRFWNAVHQPNSIKTPLLLELREQTIASTQPPKVGFSRLIGKAPTIADPKQIVEVASEILIRAEKVDEFVGIIEGDTK